MAYSPIDQGATCKDSLQVAPCASILMVLHFRSDNQRRNENDRLRDAKGDCVREKESETMTPCIDHKTSKVNASKTKLPPFVETTERNALAIDIAELHSPMP